MKLYFKVILLNYLKYFLILFFGIDILFIAIDALSNYEKIPEDAIYLAYYFFYTSISAIAYISPICIILALLLSKFSMIKNNELIVYYSLGISKKKVLLPNFICAVFLVFCFLGLNFTDFAYAYEYRHNILKTKTVKRNINNIFFTHNDKIIYIKQYHYRNIQDIEIITLKDNKITSQILAKSGVFNNDEWVLKDVKIKTYEQDLSIGKKSITTNYEEENKSSMTVKPEVFQGLNLQDNLSIKDAFYIYNLLKSQSLDTARVRAVIYSVYFMPFFAPFLIVIMFYYLPNMRRYGDFTLTSLALILFSLLVYGVLMFLSRLGINGVLPPEISTVLPVVVLGCVAFWFYYKKS